MWPDDPAGDVPEGRSPTEAREDLLRRVRTEQVRLALIQLRRIPPLHILVDLGCVLLVLQAGASPWVWGWLLAMAGIIGLRTRYLLRLSRLDIAPEVVLRRMAVTLALQGVWHSIIIIVAAQQADVTVHYAISVIMLGVAAGAITPAAGNLPIYVSWALPFGTVLGGSWLYRDGAQVPVFAVLLVALMFLFATYVRDQGLTIGKLVELADRLRQSRDRAEREQARAEAAHRLAESASQARTRFFAAASHDLRQPLHALSINAATIRALAEHHVDQNLVRVSQVIQRSLSDSRRLLDSLLEISELDAGAVRPALCNVDLIDLLKRVQQGHAALAESKGLTLSLTVHEVQAAPPGRTDPVLLERILSNLLGNAIKFTTEGGVTLGAAWMRETSQWQLTVRDSGPGIDASEFDRIFEEFYQIGNPERDRSRGLGLGLAIVRKLGELIGVRVRVLESGPSGSVFEVCVPEGDLRWLPQPVLEPLSDGDSIDDLRGLAYRVLVVDDEKAVRDALITLFGVLGWDVRAVADGAEARLEVERGWRPDAVVVDFRLRTPDDGLDVWRDLVTCLGPVPTVLVTGDTSPERISRAKQAGLPLLFKPVDGLALARMLHDLMD